MSDFRKHMERRMQDTGIRAEYEKLLPEYEYVRAIVATRAEKNITQKELAEKTGIRQSNISRIERGSCSPTIATLSALAEGMGKQLHIEFR